MSETKTLAVSLGDRRIGYLVNLPDDATAFAFDDDYVNDPHRPTLSQSYYEDDGSLKPAGKATRRLAPPFFSNLLPEGGMRTLVARNLDVSPDRDFPLLQHLGANLLGAVRLAPAPEQRAAAPDASMLALALPGVQMKLSVLLAEEDALTLPVSAADGGEWIVKVSSGGYAGLVENEFSMLAFARAVGIEVPPTRLLDPQHVRGLPPEFNAHGPALAIRRFDRGDDGARVHIEDFNQAFGQFPHDKYKHVTYGDAARMLHRRAGQNEAIRFLERIVFNAAIVNGNMHLKNWSLIYRDGRTPELAPAYDVLSNAPYEADHHLDTSLALTFGASRDTHSLGDERLRRFSKQAELPYPLVAKKVATMVERIREAWSTLGSVPMLPQHRAVLDVRLRQFIDSFASQRPTKSRDSRVL